MKTIIIFLSIILSSSMFAKDNKKQEKEFLYKLKLVPRLLVENAWTENDNKIVREHFERLDNDTEKGKVILAGRTLNNDSTQFGIVIFKAKTEKEAEQYMNNDPAVKNKIMTASLFPFRTALISK